MIGSSQNPTAHPRTKIAGPVLPVGLTEVFVTGIEIRWIRVRHSPMAMGARTLGGGNRLYRFWSDLPRHFRTDELFDGVPRLLRTADLQ